MAQRKLKPETQAIKLAQPITESEFTHIISGAGILHFNSNNLAKPVLVGNFGKAGQYVYQAIKAKTPDYFTRSFTRKLGKKKTHPDLIEYAYNQGKMDEKGRLIMTIDLSETSPLRKYQGDTTATITDDIVLQDDHMSKLQLSFFQLFNYMLSKEHVGFVLSLEYMKDNGKIPFGYVSEIMKEINVL